MAEKDYSLEMIRIRPEEKMSEIKITLKNRTNCDLVFHYNDEIYKVPPGESDRCVVQAGNQVWVESSNSMSVESDLFVGVLNDDIVIECKTFGKHLKLFRGV